MDGALHSRLLATCRVMTYLDDRAIRREMWEASNRRGTQGDYDNRSLVVEILELRREKARLLGYHDFADLVLEERMAGQGAKAQAFVEVLRDKTEPFFETENQHCARLRPRWAMRVWSPGTLAM